MPPPRTVTWPRDPHTAAKHRILRRYLEAWLPILMRSSANWKRLTYAEGFAGPGVYDCGEPGSPVIALDVFLTQRTFLDQGKTLNVILIEKCDDRRQLLQHEVDKAIARYAPIPQTLHLTYANETAAEALPRLLHDTRANEGPVFAVLDSWGGPDVPLSLARSIAQIPAGEVFVTFGTSHLTRFGSAGASQQAGDLAFGGAAWRQVLDLPAEQKKPFLVDTYRDSLTQAGFSYVISFEMRDEGGHDLHLVFGTRHRRGLEKMKDAMWKVDPVHGIQFRDPRDPDQLAFEINLDPNTAPLRRSLLTELAKGDRTVQQLRDHALFETVYRAEHVSSVLRELRDQGIVRCTPRRITKSTVIHLQSEPLI